MSFDNAGQSWAEIDWLVVVGRDQACYNVNEIHQTTHQQGSKAGISCYLPGQNRFVQQHSTFIDDTPAKSRAKHYKIASLYCNSIGAGIYKPHYIDEN